MTTDNILAASYVAAVRSNGSVDDVLDAFADGNRTEIVYEIQEHLSRLLGVEVDIETCEAAVAQVETMLRAVETHKTYRVLVQHVVAARIHVEAESESAARQCWIDGEYDDYEVIEWGVADGAPLGVISVEEV